MSNHANNTPTLPGIELPEAAGVFLSAAGPGMGEYSGDILRARQPQLYQAAIELLARGYGIRDTAQILKMSPRSIMAIRDREPEAIATIKHRVSKIWLDVAQLAAEVTRDKLLDDPDSISFKDAAIGGAVAVDKHLVMSGEATQRIEHVIRSGDDDFTRMMEDARRRGQLIEGEVINQAPDMDMSPEAGRTKGGAAAGQADQAAGGPIVTETFTPDIQSTVLGALCQQIGSNGADVTGCATGEVAPGPVAGGDRGDADGAPRAAADEGGRGSAARRGPVGLNISDPTEFLGKGDV